MKRELMKENISSKKTFKVECQRCKCKKASLSVQPARVDYESDRYYLTCHHCQQTVSFSLNEW